MSVGRSPARAPVVLDHVVVIGGGCYGSWYVQQLDRAWQHGAFRAERVTVVDRDAECRVARERTRYPSLPLHVVTATWHDFLAAWLATTEADGHARDAIVPSPLMPHLLLDWLVARAEARVAGLAVRVDPLASAPPFPWERGAPDGRHYVSFATWTCPVTCIEPARCPATRGPRDWSMPGALEAYVEAERARGAHLDGSIIFHCVHRTWGVGMIDARAVVDADRRLAALDPAHPARFLVGTVSHCHGALGVLHVEGASPIRSSSPVDHVRRP